MPLNYDDIAQQLIAELQGEGYTAREAWHVLKLVQARGERLQMPLAGERADKLFASLYQPEGGEFGALGAVVAIATTAATAARKLDRRERKARGD